MAHSTSMHVADSADVAATDPIGATGSNLRVLLLVSSLERGGAERQVVHLANGLARQACTAHVVALSPRVPLADDLDERTRLHVVPKRWRFDVGVVGRVAEIMRTLHIDVVHAFLFDAEMVARLAARRAGVPAVIASERNSDYVRPRLHAACLRLTRSWFDVMIANSNAGKQFNMRTQGLADDRIHVVHNGVDIERFRPQDRAAARAALGLDLDGPIVGMAASFKPQKNHMMFLRVAEALHRRCPAARFVCVGEPLQVQDDRGGALTSGARGHGQSRAYHAEVSAAIRDRGLGTAVKLLGRQEDMVSFYNACDVVVLTSRHEGTPNVLLEAMACACPVVATRVADNELIVPEGRVGYVVGLDDDASMVAHVARLIEDPAARAALGDAARTWVVQRFSIAAMVERTAEIYRQTWARKVGRSA